MLDAVWDFETHTVQTEAESILLEGKLIKEYRPRYNVSFRDDKRFLLVKVDQTEEWPRFRLTRLKKDDGARYFGPYAHAGALRQTLNFMRKKFGVLTFGRGAPTERELKSATYQVPMRLSEISAQQYRERVAQACRTKIVIGATASAPSPARMTSRAWPKWSDGGTREFCLKRAKRIRVRRSFRKKKQLKACIDWSKRQTLNAERRISNSNKAA